MLNIRCDYDDHGFQCRETSPTDKLKGWFEISHRRRSVDPTNEVRHVIEIVELDEGSSTHQGTLHACDGHHLRSVVEAILKKLDIGKEVEPPEVAPPPLTKL
jgi:hypothetical protein